MKARSGLTGQARCPPQGSRGPSGPLGNETEACHKPLGAIGALGGAVLGEPNHSRRATSPKGRPGGGQGRDHGGDRGRHGPGNAPPDSYEPR